MPHSGFHLHAQQNYKLLVFAGIFSSWVALLMGFTDTEKSIEDISTVENIIVLSNYLPISGPLSFLLAIILLFTRSILSERHQHFIKCDTKMDVFHCRHFAVSQ